MQGAQGVGAVQLTDIPRTELQGLEPNLRVSFSTSQAAVAASRMQMWKKQIIAQRTGTNWELTADSTPDPGKLNAEYTLDGRKIKAGSGDSAAAGKAWADTL